ncbi:type VI secretion system protein TssH [Burkholderia lata]|uniref:Type VI secretion system protein TssH n=1 Tax=Burkholderia lata (strain ATCC 17760 / DSM 23089 / LMG 22485 / NCIMB 9086 / R18194 / 383) TaxID=482957 RepID=A0A6P2SJY0_BURL3|nr:type VI secretion system ATPase TssH [Burkholderia lata]VWC49490.1 type VI secretion system protein TssH [Burkholderia lata]
MSLEPKTLISRLDNAVRIALERAAQRCLLQTHFHVEVEHLLLELIEIDGGDLECILPRFAIERDALVKEITRAVELFRRGNTRTPAFSVSLVQLLQDALLLSSIVLQHPQVRSSTLLLATLENEALRVQLSASAPTVLRVSASALRANISEWLADSRELSVAASVSRTPDQANAVCTQPTLDQYTSDLTAEARAGRIDPIIGRNTEIRQTVDILMRRRQNNPILVGAPGVGKTAIVEGLALRIAAGDVPPPLAGVTLRTLDLALLQAGAGVKGEFEQRLKTVIDEVRQSQKPIILFIDEAHTMIGVGGTEGHADVANLLKPALARGELRTIAATTWLEYKKYFERDPALARRFQLVQVEEPDEQTAVAMLRGVTTRLETHHGVAVLEAAIVDAVKLSHRYISGRQLPDKAIAVLDTACARVALAQHDTPPQLESARHREHTLGDELQRLRREMTMGANHVVRVSALEVEHRRNAMLVRALSARWRDEAAAVSEILATRVKLAALDEQMASSPASNSDPGFAEQFEDLSAELARLESGLEAIRDDDLMVPVCVDSKAVAAVVASWTGIPVGKMLADEMHAVRTLQTRLAERIVGQDAALATIATRIQAYRAGLTDPKRPVGAFLLIGPTGVGKTETAYALADALYGGERNLIVVNLSEYQEAHTVSQLKGAPPGYVGYGVGGALTEAVRRHPYSVVLLDEIEKAHADVIEAFYNVFDKGMMEDGTGLTVDFRNTTILATSNVGAELMHGALASLPNEAFASKLREALLAAFRPALLARMTAVPYRALDDTVLRSIIERKLEVLKVRYHESTGKQFAFDAGIIQAVLSRCRSAGARDIDSILTNELVGTLAQWALE